MLMVGGEMPPFLKFIFVFHSGGISFIRFLYGLPGHAGFEPLQQPSTEYPIMSKKIKSIL